MDAARQRTLMYAAGIAVLMLASDLLTARAVARPIRAMTRAVQAMADGETGAAIGFCRIGATRSAAWPRPWRRCAAPCEKPSCRAR